VKRQRTPEQEAEFRQRVAEAKQRHNVSDVIGRVTTLKPAGREKKGLCFVHQEKTPSLYVNDHLGVFLCRGCGASGDLFTAVELIEKTDFAGALRWLGVADLPTADPAKRIKAIAREEADSDTKVDAAAFVWKTCTDVEGTPGQLYLAGRGITRWHHSIKFARTWAWCDWETGETGPDMPALVGYLDHLADLSRRRHLTRALVEVREDIADTGLPLDQSAAAIEMALSAALFSTTAREAVGIADAWNEAIAHARAVGAGDVDRGARIARLLEWNDLTGGMSPGELILLGGRPGMGKTAVSLAVARCAAEAGHGVLFVSREMSVAQLMPRLIADMLFEAGSSATFDDVRSGRLSEQDLVRAAEIGARIASWPLMFEEPPRLNVSRVQSLIRKHQRRMAATGTKLVLVVIDYLGLLEPPQKRSNREQEMGDTSRELKIAAKATGTTILALAQLNRAVEQRDDKRPHLADLRDSGSLEQDADTVVFAYRAEYYLRQAEPDPADMKKRQAWEVEMGAATNRLELHAAKVRQGPTQRRKLHFFAGRQAVRSDDFYRTGGMA
jgi:replicative DNA helicase